MRESLKQQLDESVPVDVTLTDLRKRQILKAAQQAGNGRKISRVPKMLPALAGVAVIGLAGVLGYPYVNDWQGEPGGAVEDRELQKLVVPEQDYDVLIRSIYNEYTGELVLNDSNKIYAFDPIANEETLLVDLDEETRSFQFETEGKWLAWEEFTDETAVLKIMNRETSEVETLEGVHIIDLQIEGNRLVFGQFGGEAIPSYQSVNLDTMEIETIHEMTGDGGMGAASTWNEILVIPEQAEQEGVPVTNIYIYNLVDNSQIQVFTFPNQEINGLVVNNNRIYAEFREDEMESYFLGYIDIETGELTEISTPNFNEFSVDGDYLALSVADEADSSDLQLYKMTGSDLEEVSAFSAIEERLVKPRFTDKGTLVVNGEGEDLAMYLLDVAE